MLAHTVTLMHVPWTPPTMQVGAPELELAAVLDDDAVEDADELTVALEGPEVDEELVTVVVVVEELEAGDEVEVAFAPPPLLDGPAVTSVPVLPPAADAPPGPARLPPRPSLVVLVTAPPIPVAPDERPPRPLDPETRSGP
jgi:hypothetical protein